MKRILSGIVALCLLLLITACKQSEIKKYTVPNKMESVISGTVAENSRYTLEWDDKTKCVLMKDRQSGQTWSTTPYDKYLTGETSYSLSSPLVIEYYDKSDGSIQTAKAFDCISDGLVSAKKDGSNLRVTFYFKAPEITVTLIYKLRDDSLQISLNTSDFKETGKTNLISISVTPYLCSAVNTMERSSYLFVPSGSGALMYTDEDPSGTARSFSGEVYGNDPAKTLLDNPGDEEPVRLPVFGVKAGENALCAIIENGDGAAQIDAIAGNSQNKYSAAYATFYVRGSNHIEWNSTKGTGSKQNIYNDSILLSKTWPENKQFTVGYYPLTGENADYNGMATCYRNYLKNTGGLKKSELVQQPYHVTLIGGAEIKEFTLGIPHKSLLPLTTFEQAQTILNQLVENTKQIPEVLLKGFGNSGFDIGQIAGGFGFSSATGGQEGHKQLEAFCQNKDVPLFTDFDMLHFTRSGNGFSTLFNTARAADAQSVGYFPLMKNVRTEDKEKTKILFLQRSKLETVAKKLTKFSKDRISGIGLSSLGQTAYSDYREEKYALKGGMSEQTRSILKTIKDSGHQISLSSANAYIAGLSGSIFDVSLQNGGYDALDETVPFYQMVFRGMIPMYSTPLNLSVNPENALLRCVEFGVSPSFVLSYSIDSMLADSSDSLYYGILYDSNKTMILDTVKRTTDFFNKIEGAEIKSHMYLENNRTQTVFSNGVAVTVNYNDGTFTIDE